jgi:hypothetical protein
MKYTPESHPIIIKCKAHQTEPIDRLTEFQGNLKRLSEKNREKLIGSICNKGFIAPIFVWDDHGDWKLLDGHQRIKTLLWMREHGWDIPMLPVDVIEADDEQDAKKKLLAITSTYGEFDIDGYLEFTSDIEIDDTIRLADGEFECKSNKEIETTEEDNEIPKEPAEKLQEKWKTRIGDIWKCGNHIIACGSSDDEELVLKLLKNNQPTVCFTDPPYGVSIGDKNKMLNEHQESRRVITNIENPTMKPVELYINAYLNNSEEGDYAYEPFSGSGTSLIAGEKTNRNVIAIELDPKYVAVALERWSILTGKQPEKL